MSVSSACGEIIREPEEPPLAGLVITPEVTEQQAGTSQEGGLVCVPVDTVVSSHTDDLHLKLNQSYPYILRTKRTQGYYGKRTNSEAYAEKSQYTEKRV